MWGILGVFLQAAAGQILYLALHLESGSFPTRHIQSLPEAKPPSEVVVMFDQAM